MGMPIAQAAQPISQQQPAQGKGPNGAPVNSPSANFQQIDDTMQQIMPAVMPQQQQPQGKGVTQITPNTPIDATSSNMQAPAVMPNGQQGKGMQSQQQPQQQQYGKSGTTNSATSGQPRMGQGNPYPNTIQPWDNANIQPQTQSGKGKGY